MAVAELIKQLEKMPQDKEVILNRAFTYPLKEVFYNERENCVVIFD